MKFKLWLKNIIYSPIDLLGIVYYFGRICWELLRFARICLDLARICYDFATILQEFPRKCLGTPRKIQEIPSD